MWVSLRYLAFRRVGPVVIENGLLAACVLLAFKLRFNLSPFELPADERPVLKAVLVAMVLQLFLHLRDVYDFGKAGSLPQLYARLGQGMLLASFALAVLYYIFPALILGRGTFIISIGLIAVCLGLWHTVLRLYLGGRVARANVLVMGTGQLAKQLVSEILAKPDLGMRVCGFLDEDPKLLGTSIVNPKVLGVFTDLANVVARSRVDRVIVELQDRRGRLPIEILLKLKTRGVPIEDVTTFYERVLGKIAIENLKPSWMIFNRGFEVSRSVLLQRRILSLLIASVLLILFSPAFLLIMTLIKLDSRGQIFFRQDRVGQDGAIFTLYKFRTMYEDAERDTGPVWATADDRRVTRVGRVLRRRHLDELPQLWNVLRGDMSLVGPRPERPHFVKDLIELIPFYQLRHSVKPGMTGWAQINYHYGNSVRDSVEKLQYDLFYIKHMTWLLDCVILFETVKTVLVRKGS